QLRSRLPEYSKGAGGWRYRYVLVVGNHRHLWCGRLYGGPCLVCDRAATDRRRASTNPLKWIDRNCRELPARCAIREEHLAFPWCIAQTVGGRASTIPQPRQAW